MTLYNHMLTLNKDRFADVEFFKKITARIGNKEDFEIANGKKYKAVKDENNQSVLKYELQTVQ